MENFEERYDITLPYGTTRAQAAAMLSEEQQENFEEIAAGDIATAEGWIRQNLEHEEMKSLADWADKSSMWTPSTFDINRFFEEEDDSDIVGLYQLFNSYPDDKQRILDLLEEGKDLIEIETEITG